MKILISANSFWNFYNFRKDFIFELKKRNHQIVLIAPKDNFYFNYFKSEKISCEIINYKNKTYNPLINILTLFQIFYKLQKIKPDILINFTMKINILFSLTSFFFKFKVINNITGIGTSMINSKFQKILVINLLKISFKKSNLVFFQNNEDKKFFIENKIITNKKSIVLKYFGVNVIKYKFSPLIFKDFKNLNFLFFGRIIKDKGIFELIEAIKLVKKKFPESQFTIVGQIDYNNPGFIDQRLIDEWVNKNIINYHKFTNTPEKFIKDADCIILPSYREGLPKSLLESQAIGRPVIATNVPGCNDLIKENFNGFLCKPKNAISLFEKIIDFINLPFEKKRQMSENAYNFIDQNYKSRSIINKYINVLNI
ncbi:glycosyltransferase family 4 protein [Alphaproteobacteria bacterium]|nr:glycosyltransferase family 4 protein [Alphaproteobacteria bacterium]